MFQTDRSFRFVKLGSEILYLFFKEKLLFFVLVFVCFVLLQYFVLLTYFF